MTMNTQQDEIDVEQQTNDVGKVLTLVQRRFYASDRCITARMELQQLVDSTQFNTESCSFDATELGFVDRHLYYLSTHPGILIAGYISNLKLMTRVRPQ
jgi:hypothetical protein